MIWVWTLLFISSSILSVNSQENEIFSCASNMVYEGAWSSCSFKNSTISTTPNYTDTDDVKNKVRIIRIVNGELRELPEKLFLNYRNLINIMIDECSLYEITTESFKSASNLEAIWMKMSQIVTLNSNIFNDCKKVSNLDLSGNLIENISSDVFQPVVQLKYLDLSNNRIKSVENLMFSNMDFLNLRNNLIEEFSGNIINISSVKLQNNFLSSLKLCKSCISIDASNNKISKIIVEDGSVVESITVKNNSLNDLRNISKCANLRELKLSENNIQVKLDTFSGLSKLQELDISKNNGTIGEDLGFLKPLQSLKYLTVQQDAITNYKFKNILKIIPAIRQVQLLGETIQIDYNPENDGFEGVIQPRF